MDKKDVNEKLLQHILDLVLLPELVLEAVFAADRLERKRKSKCGACLKR
jgi:hypothetical protein